MCYFYVNVKNMGLNKIQFFILKVKGASLCARPFSLLPVCKVSTHSLIYLLLFTALAASVLDGFGSNSTQF